jgi:hypothetical protein
MTIQQNEQIMGGCIIDENTRCLSQFLDDSSNQFHMEVGAHFREDCNWETWPSFPISPSKWMIQGKLFQLIIVNQHPLVHHEG